MPGEWGPPPWRRRGLFGRRRGRPRWLFAPLIWVALFWGGAAWLWHGGAVLSGGAGGYRGLVFGILLAATGAAAWVTLTYSRRLDRLRARVEQLNLRALDVRVPVEGRGAVAALAQAFNRMVDRLEAEERVRRQLFADVAHELRHPLAVLKARLEALQDGVLTLDGEQVLHLQDMVIGLSRLVDDVRDLSLADVGQLALTLGPVDLNALVREVLESLGPLAEDRGIALCVDTAASLGPIVADRDRLRQVVVNLLTNALRYTPAGGKAGVSTRRVGGQAVVEVWDSGVGIAAETLAHVFERFYRGDAARARTTVGSGLGLAIVQSLVELHGGSVAVRSPDAGGVGTRFTVRLPAAGPDPSDGRSPEPTRRPAGPRPSAI